MDSQLAQRSALYFHGEPCPLVIFGTKFYSVRLPLAPSENTAHGPANAGPEMHFRLERVPWRTKAQR